MGILKKSVRQGLKKPFKRKASEGAPLEKGFVLGLLKKTICMRY